MFKDQLVVKQKILDLVCNSIKEKLSMYIQGVDDVYVTELKTSNLYNEEEDAQQFTMLNVQFEIYLHCNNYVTVDSVWCQEIYTAKEFSAIVADSVIGKLEELSAVEKVTVNKAYPERDIEEE